MKSTYEKRYGVNHATVLCPESEMLDTQWGRLTYNEWCIRESQRMNGCGAGTRVLKVQDGKCCIVREVG